ncbi:MAG: CAP domain-containing protein, partial [Nitrospinae bacterium]|nr:CAP domain-containing protein [Nitrospinota bacterium]
SLISDVNEVDEVKQESPVTSTPPQTVEEIIPLLDPLPPKYLVRYNLKKAEYENKKFPMPQPETYTGAIVGVYGKTEEGIFEIDKKTYAINFTSEEEASQFVEMMVSRYKRADSDVDPKVKEVGPLTVYSRYSNGANQYLGSFFSLGKYVYYLRTSFSQDEELEYIKETFLIKQVVTIEMTPDESETTEAVEGTEESFTAVEPKDLPEITFNIPDFKGAINDFLSEQKEKWEQHEYEQSKEALEYVNALRAQNGKGTLQWSDELYNLALFRAKDMSDRYYFDHVTPEGRCVNHFASQFGVSSSVAENLAKGHYSRDEATNDWMTSRGHRYNLLYTQHTIGAIAKSGDVYVFLGTGPSEYGWQCATGEQGLAYWNSALTQPGEV